MKDVLIIGGHGYIGSHLTEFLSNLDIEVTAFGSRQDDYNKLDTEFIQSFNNIVLLAGHSSVQMCIGELQAPWNNNIRNFYNLVNKLSPGQNLIYASSASVYGNRGEKVYTESDMNVNFINNYDLTKTTLDLHALNFISQGKNIVGLRFGTVNGPSRVIRRDLMINSMVYSALKDRVVFINNKHVNRPILDIRDLCKAIFTIIKTGVVPGIFNLASFNSNVEIIADKVKDITNTKIIDLGDKPGIYNFQIDTTKFQTTYNFKFEGNIDRITRQVVDCYNSPETTVVIRNEYFNYE